MAAAATLQRVDAAATITLLTRERYRPYAKMALPYLLSGEAQEQQLYLHEPPGVSIRTDEEVVRIDPGAQRLETASGARYSYDRLLIATGGEPETLKAPGADLPFVHTIRNIPDVEGIKKQMNKGRGRAVIAGAGPVSMETGDSLHRLGMDLTFVVSSNRVFSTLMDPEAATFVEERLERRGIEIRKGQDITRIDEDRTVHFSSGEKCSCEIVIVGKGVKPSLAFLAGSGIALRTGIVVDEHQQTNIPGIFAAGDVAETYDIAFCETRLNALWPAAAEQGRIAGLNMAGVTTPYPGSLARNILRVFDIPVLSAGMARADGPEVLKARGKDHYRKLVLDKGILKGLLFVGDLRNEGLYISLMQRRVNSSAFARGILRDSFTYSRFLRTSMMKGTP